jgi:hypothetical protein
VNKAHRFAIRSAVGLLLLAFLSSIVGTRVLASTASTTLLKITFKPIDDAYVSSSSPNTNYGSSTSLHADASPTMRSYLRFTVAGINGAPIVGAKLWLFAKSSSSAGLTASAVWGTAWRETSVTYASMPTLGASLATSSAVSSGTWIGLDVTSFVKWPGTYSFGVTTSGSTDVGLASRESGANGSQLVVTFGISSPTPTPLPHLRARLSMCSS